MGGFLTFVNRPSSFVIRYSAVRCLIQAIETASLIIMKLCHFGVVSYERRFWPKKTASLIGKETDEHRTSNECILPILKMTERSLRLVGIVA
jgi:hypothetical protein